jgi:hypothetical protein
MKEKNQTLEGGKTPFKKRKFEEGWGEEIDTIQK